MGWELTLGLVMGGFFLLMIIGIPVVFAFFTVNVLGMFFLMGGSAGLEQLVKSIYDSLTVFVLLPITLFILMGELMFRAGIAGQMIDTLDKWIGRVPGRLSLLTVFVGTLLSALSGASIAMTALLGSTLAPEMERRGYHRTMSLAPILGAAGMDIMIPPSGLGVILAVVAGVPVGDFLVAITVPGILMAAIFATWIILKCWFNPSLAPQYEVASVPLLQRIKLTLLYVVPLGSIFFLVIGLIFLGVATPTEAAALGVSGSLIMVFIYQGIQWKVIRGSLDSTLSISVMVLVILAGSQAFSQIMAFSGANRELVRWVLALPLQPIFIILGMQALVLILGCFIGGVPLIMITIPVFMPIVIALRYNPLLFSVVMLINIAIAQLTPPYGICLYVLKGVAPEGTTMADIIRAAVPIIILDVFTMALIMLFPPIALWGPNLLK